MVNPTTPPVPTSIAGLPAASVPLSGGEFLPIVQNGITSRVTVSQTLAGAGIVVSGTAGQLAYYAATGTTLSGNPNANISNGALTLGQVGSVQGSLVLDGSASGSTTLAAPTSGGGTMTLQAGSDTLVGKATTDIFTNKTFDTAATGNSFKINGTAITAVTGSGSVVLATSPTLVTPVLGVAAATSLTFGGGVLSSYDFNTWTPVLTYVTPGNLSVSYSTQAGSYIKIGRMVTLFLNITTSAFTHTTSSGTCIITGVPFAASLPSGSNSAFGSLGVQGITKANFTNFVLEIDNGNSNLAINASGSAQTNGTVQSADMPTGGSVILIGTITYMAAT